MLGICDAELVDAIKGGFTADELEYLYTLTTDNEQNVKINEET